MCTVHVVPYHLSVEEREKSIVPIAAITMVQEAELDVQGGCRPKEVHKNHGNKCLIHIIYISQKQNLLSRRNYFFAFYNVSY